MEPPERPPSSTPSPPDSPDFEMQRRWVQRANRGNDGFVTVGDDGASSPGEPEQLIEEERLHRAIPRVKPRTTEELDVEPPPKQRYPTEIRRALRELWETREVMLTFVERDLRVRYKQAALGAFWAIIQPIMLMVIFSVVFGKIAKVGSEHVPYPAFSYAALVPWSLFTSSISYATGSIVGNSAIIRKIHMPREIFALAGIFSSGVDWAVSFVILVVMLTVFHFTGSAASSTNCEHCLPNVHWLAVPLLLGVLTMLMIAASLIAAAITVYFRDTRYGIPLLTQILLYATPVAYPIAKMVGPCQRVPGLIGLQCGVLHGFWAKAYPYLNPLAPLMDGFRRVMTHGQWPAWGPVCAAAAVSFVAMCLSYWWYKRIDRTFADVI